MQLNMKKILIVSTTGMGDCLWGTPGIRAVKKTFPEVQVNLLVNWMWKPLFDDNPYLNEIFEYRIEWYRQPILRIQVFKRNALLSIVAGTAVYMFFVQI